MSTTSPEIKQAAPRPDPQARLREVHQAAGFMPTSRIELVEAWQLLEPGITTQYLDSVLGHQVKHHIVKPGRAVTTKATSYADFAHKAFMDRWMLEQLDDNLNDVRSAVPLTALATTELITGVAQLVRYHDLNRYAQPVAASSLPFSPLYPYHNGKSAALDAYTVKQPAQIVAARIAEVSSTLRLADARSVVQDAISDQQARVDFWEVRAREAGASMSGQTVGTVALEGFGVSTQE